MKYLRFIILFFGFIGMVIYLNITGEEESNRINKALNNNVKFEGYIVDIKQSNNHAFGIIRLELTESSIGEFDKKIKDTLKNGIYPYRIKGTQAELYTIIPDGIDEGDIVKLKSSEKNCHYYNVKTKQNSEGYIWMITNDTDIDFVKENTIF
jgi:hypothetical protein